MYAMFLLILGVELQEIKLKPVAQQNIQSACTNQFKTTVHTDQLGAITVDSKLHVDILKTNPLA